MVKGSQTKSCCGGRFRNAAGALNSRLDAFSRREPAPASLENAPSLQMCPFAPDFKHVHPAKRSDSPHRGNASSIMRAKVLSIMRDGDAGLTSLFKSIPKAPR
jgi:hypothetical protein